MNSRLMKTIVILISVLIGFACIVVVLLNIPYFNVDEIIVTYKGAASSFLPDIERVVSRFYGNNLVGINKQEVEDLIMGQKMVESVKVSKYFPKKLIVDVTYRDFAFRAVSQTDSEINYYLVSEDTIVAVSRQTYLCFDGLVEVLLDAEYSEEIYYSGFDEGFTQLAVLVGQCTSKDVITGIIYTNNNRKTFGSLEMQLTYGSTTLTVKDPVTPQRLDEALSIIEKEVSQYGPAEYVLYAAVLDRKG